MTLDRVHDLQSAFRKLVSAHARPGTIVDLGPETRKIGDETGLPPEFLLLALTLLDGETTFAVRSAGYENRERAISRLTSAPRGSLESAAFVLVPDADTDANPVFDACSPGTLLDPHLGATVIIGAREISPTRALVLTGPGIRDSAGCAIVRDGAWLPGRNRKNREYPLGVDVIFVTAEGKAVAFPRTTVITESEGGL